MKKAIVAVIFLLIELKGSSQEVAFEFQKALSKELDEISGIAHDGQFLWVVSDDKDAPIYKLDRKGNVLQKIKISNLRLIDVEAVAVDRTYIYIGDVGDNMGKRNQRAIVKVEKSDIPKGRSVSVKGQRIRFSFPEHGDVKKQKRNNYDCEAIIIYNDSVYLFTKRRKDLNTSLYVIPKIPGTYSARLISTFKTKGLVTDASVNDRTDEIALIGYDEGHTRPFIWILSNFPFDDFFSGNYVRFELTKNKELDWQIEGISYEDNGTFFIVCEKTKQVPNTLYLIKKSGLFSSDKGDSHTQ